MIHSVSVCVKVHKMISPPFKQKTYHVIVSLKLIPHAYNNYTSILPKFYKFFYSKTQLIRTVH